MARLFTNDWVEWGADARFKITGNLTWSAWVMFAAADNGIPFCTLEAGAGETAAENSLLYLYLATQNSSITDIVYVHEYSTGLNITETWGAANLSYTSPIWTHITVARDVSANTIYWYKNGVISETDPYATNDPTTTATTLLYTIGGRSDHVNLINDMTIAEVGLWNRRLSADEIASLGNGFSPDHYMFGLQSYVPFIGSSTNCLLNGTPTSSSGGAAAEHPSTIIYPNKYCYEITIPAGGITVTPGVIALTGGLQAESRLKTYGQSSISLSGSSQTETRNKSYSQDLNTIVAGILSQTIGKGYNTDIQSLSSTQQTPSFNKSYSQDLQTLIGAVLTASGVVSSGVTVVADLNTLTSALLVESRNKTYSQALNSLIVALVAQSIDKTYSQDLQTLVTSLLSQTTGKSYTQDLIGLGSSLLSESQNKIYTQDVLGLSMSVYSTTIESGFQDLLVLSIGIFNPTIIVAGIPAVSSAKQYDDIFQAIYNKLKELN